MFWTYSSLCYIPSQKWKNLPSGIALQVRITFMVGSWNLYHSRSYFYMGLIFWYQKIDFLISENTNHFFISKIQFLISRIRIFYINKWFSDIKKSNSSYQKNKLFSDIKNLNFWKSIFWYKKFRVLFLYLKMIFWY